MSEKKAEPTNEDEGTLDDNVESNTTSVAAPKDAEASEEAAASEEANAAASGPDIGVDDSAEAPASSGEEGASEEGRPKRLFRLRGRFRREGREKGGRKRRRRLRPPTDFRRELTTIPNILTYIRILMLPLILLVLDRENRWASFVSGCLFSAACFTDFFDGYFARKFNQVTVLGKLLDPLADKLIVSATLIVMIPMGRLPSWLVIVLLAREFAITGLRGIAASEDMVIASAPLAKFKTAFQMLALFCLLIHYPYQINYIGLFSFEVSFHRMGMALLYIALFFSITSAIDYFWKFARAINQHYEESQDPEAP